MITALYASILALLLVWLAFQSSNKGALTRLRTQMAA